MNSFWESKYEGAERSIRFLQTAHTEVLSGLHNEIETLQKQCSDYALRLSMQASTAQEKEELDLKFKSYNSEYRKKDALIVEQKKLIDERNRAIKTLQERIRTLEKKLEIEASARDQSIATLKEKVDSQSQQIASLTFQMHKSKQQQQHQLSSSVTNGGVVMPQLDLRKELHKSSVNSNSNSDSLNTVGGNGVSSSNSTRQLLSPKLARNKAKLSAPQPLVVADTSSLAIGTSAVTTGDSLLTHSKASNDLLDQLQPSHKNNSRSKVATAVDRKLLSGAVSSSSSSVAAAPPPPTTTTTTTRVVTNDNDTNITDDYRVEYAMTSYRSIAANNQNENAASSSTTDATENIVHDHHHSHNQHHHHHQQQTQQEQQQHQLQRPVSSSSTHSAESHSGSDLGDSLLLLLATAPHGTHKVLPPVIKRSSECVPPPDPKPFLQSAASTLHTRAKKELIQRRAFMSLPPIKPFEVIGVSGSMSSGDGETSGTNALSSGISQLAVESPHKTMMHNGHYGSQSSRGGEPKNNSTTTH